MSEYEDDPRKMDELDRMGFSKEQKEKIRKVAAQLQVSSRTVAVFLVGGSKPPIDTGRYRDPIVPDALERARHRINQRLPYIVWPPETGLNRPTKDDN